MNLCITNIVQPIHTPHSNFVNLCPGMSVCVYVCVCKVYKVLSLSRILTTKNNFSFSKSKQGKEKGKGRK